jgi:hypothetical protein
MKICRCNWKCLVAAMFVALTIAAPSGLMAQQTSAVNGRITDVPGAAIANADVSVAPWTPAMPG